MIGDKSLLAKLHDILKLTGESEKHFCPEWLDEFHALDPELKKALKHHCVCWYWTKAHKPGCNPFPMDAEMLCIHLADVKASTISRRLRTSKYGSHKAFRIWRDIKKTNDILVKEKNELVQHPNILDDRLNYINLNDFYNSLETDFLLRSEDAKHCPFASLQTHNELTALWFTFFMNNQRYLGIQETIINSRERNRIMYAFSKTEIAIVRMKLRVNTKLSRLRDAKLIKDIPRILEELCSELKGVKIYDLADEILAITVPEQASNIAQKVADTLRKKTNYYFETTIVNSILSNKKFLYNYKKIFGTYQENLYPDLEREISVKDDNEASHRAIICDMCQMAPASIVYPQEVYGSSGEFEPVEEFLCEGCKEIREDADRAPNLARWETEENAGVAFFKITLDMPELIKLLKELFTDVFGFEKVINEDLGFSILKEFLRDYAEFLKVFRERILRYEDYGEKMNHELILDNLFCIRIRKNSDVKPLVGEYAEIISSDIFFSQMAIFAKNNKRSFPIKLSITSSNVKYPFMEHWQALNDPKDEINIYAVPHTKLEISLEKYACLKDAGIEDKKISSALHKLAEIEERTKSQFLVTVSMLEMKNDLKGLARYLITTKELSINETLAYYKIMRD